MITDQLYELAFLYKKTKLWQKLWDTQLFAITLTEGRTGYISIMGAGGEHNALALYIGQEGLDSYRKMVTLHESAVDPLVFKERLMSQKCLQCAFESKDELSKEEREEAKCYAKAHGIRISGKNAYPQFVKYEPYCYPWFLQNDQDQQDLCQALSAAIALSQLLEEQQPETLGFCDIRSGVIEIPLLAQQEDHYAIGRTEILPEQEDQYPTPVISNDMAMAKVKKLKKMGVWECQIVRIPQAVQDEPGQPPVFPVIFLAVERTSSFLLPVSPVKQYEEQPEQLLENFLEACLKQETYPAKMSVRDQRTFAFAEEFCKKLKIRLRLEEELPVLEDVKADFFHRFGGMSEEEEQEELVEMLEVMQNLSEEELAELPPELLQRLEELSAAMQMLQGAEEEQEPPAHQLEFEGSYVISVSLGTGCYRHIRISAEATLFHLHAAILDAFAFDDDHAHAFFMDNHMWSRTAGYYMEGMDDSDRSTMDYRLGQFGLQKGSAFKYVFDFGDEWTFQCKVLQELEESTPIPRIIRKRGQAPQQYGGWEED